MCSGEEELAAHGSSVLHDHLPAPGDGPHAARHHHCAQHITGPAPGHRGHHHHERGGSHDLSGWVGHMMWTSQVKYLGR